MNSNDEYYDEEETLELVGDMDDFREYINGVVFASKVIDGKRFYRKDWVEKYANR